MNIEILLTPQVWLQARPEIRVALAKAFDMERSTSPQCITQDGVTRIETDGFTVDDLRAMNVESMQEWLGFTHIDPNADLVALFGLCADMMEKRMGMQVAETEAGSLPVIEETEDEVTVLDEKRFCEFCDSKGGRHKTNCTRTV